MKELIERLNKAFESRVRLGIMSALMVNEKIDFNTLKEMLDVSDGNLASHISALDKEGYLKIEKRFIGKVPNTTYRASASGRRAFTLHLDALEALLKNR
jgi:DNA-binding transcriptional ArsR family regulator